MQKSRKQIFAAVLAATALLGGMSAQAAVGDGVKQGDLSQVTQNGVALGSKAQAATNGSVAIGANTKAGVGSKNHATAIGFGAEALGGNSVALGANSKTSENNVVSVGSAENQRKIVNVAAGVNANDVVIKSQLDKVDKNLATLNKNVVDGFNTINQNVADGFTAINGAIANEVATREAADTTLQNNIDAEEAARKAADTTLQNNIDTVDNKVTKMNDAGITAGKVYADATSWTEGAAKATNSIAIGGGVGQTSASVRGKNSVAIGAGSTVETTDFNSANGTALGVKATVSGKQGTAVGFGSQAKGDQSTAVGEQTIAAGNQSSAFGQGANAAAKGSTAIGYRANVGSGADSGLALGAGSTVWGKNSVALGNGSIANGDNEVSVGSSGNTRKITYVTAGTLSADSTDAVNGAQLFAEQEARIAADNQLQAGINQNRAAIADLGQEVDSVGAVSAALAGLHPLAYNAGDAKFQLSAAVGAYDGNQALALGGFYNVSEDVLLSLGLSTMLSDEHKTAGNLGVTFRIGKGGKAEAAAPAVNQDILDRLAKLEAENAAQKEQIESLLAAKTL